MNLKHYYIEDVNQVMKESKKPSDPRHSIQFDLLPASNSVYANIDQINGDGKLVRASVRFPLEELKNAYEWLSEKPPKD